MKQKVLDRIQKLTEELESVIVKRQGHVMELRGMDLKIKELSSAIMELKKLLD